MTSPDTPQKEIPSIGQTLCSLREARDISQAEIAAQMHLDTRFIAAIEADNFAALPDPIYVRGYIRSYGKLVGADPDALVKQFEQQGGNFEPEIIPEVRHAAQTCSSDRPVKAFTYLIIFVLAVLLLAWWQSNFIIETPITLARGIAETDMSVPALREETPAPAIPDYRPVYATDRLQEIALVPADTLSADFDSMSATALTEPQPGSLSPATVTEQLPGALPPAGNGVPSVAPATIDPVSVITMPQPESTPVAATINTVALTTTTTLSPAEPMGSQTGPDLIVLRLKADSWIEITDANNKQVFFNLGRSGDIFNVRGTAPFDVLLGFAQAVSLEYNGKPFDAAPYSRAGVARFMLGE